MLNFINNISYTRLSPSRPDNSAWLGLSPKANSISLSLKGSSPLTKKYSVEFLLIHYFTHTLLHTLNDKSSLAKISLHIYFVFRFFFSYFISLIQKDISAKSGATVLQFLVWEKFVKNFHNYTGILEITSIFKINYEL